MCVLLGQIIMKKSDKLKKLFQQWPMHTVLPVAWLKKKNYSLSLVHAYIASNWVVSLGRGIVARPKDKIDWSGFVWGLQRLDAFHVGGKTALEVQGKAHFIKFKETNIFLFGQAGLKLPHWMKNVSEISFVKVNTKLLPDDIGIREHNFGEFSIKISNPARAFLEYMLLVGKYHTFEEAYYLMENLHFLSSDLMQEVLEKCTSLKVKRMVLCLAKKQNVHWFKGLDLSKIDIGTSVKQIVKNGAYDAQFLITYPHSWDRKEEDEVIF